MDRTYDYLIMSDSFKGMVNSIIDKIHIAMTTKTEANRYLMSWYELSAYKDPTLMDYLLMLLVYHRGEIMFTGINDNWYNHNFTRVNKDYPAWKGDDFGKDMRVYLSGDKDGGDFNLVSRFSSNYLLICNNSEGAWIPLNNFRLTNPVRSLSEKLTSFQFEAKFITKLKKWSGDSPTPEDWGLNYLYDITDIFTTEINMLGLINWPLEEPKELI